MGIQYSVRLCGGAMIRAVARSGGSARHQGIKGSEGVQKIAFVRAMEAVLVGYAFTRDSGAGNG